jgi:hypothetical protein
MGEVESGIYFTNRSNVSGILTYSLELVLMKLKGPPINILIARYFVKKFISYYASVLRGRKCFFFKGNILLKPFSL